jgi:leader peptidase (prepilin peptidase)/N-methyltransferase
MGSFYHVVATRLAKGESLISPPSHCPNCNHRLKWYELIPIVSYVIQLGKCRQCHKEIPLSYLIIEVVTGSLFSVCYHKFGFSVDLIVALIFVSSLITVIISDIEYMIILDEIIIVSSIIIMIVYLIGYGFSEVTASHIYSGVGAFVTMYGIKIIGDFIFKKESLGGGDIKLMFLFGLVLGYSTSIMTIFLATFIAFPIALVMLFTNKEHMIPFGPFLSIAALILIVSGVTFTDVINFLVR